MNFKTLLIAILTVLCFASCKKSNNSRGIYLKPLNVSGGLITLDWNASGYNPSYPFLVERITGSVILRKSCTPGVTHFVDTLPMAPDVQYRILIGTDSSNLQEYKRTDIVFMPFGFNAHYDNTTRQVYVNNLVTLAHYDMLSQKVVDSIHMNLSNVNNTSGSSSGYLYCNLGIYNGKNELYVVGWDSFIHIYDAATLMETDKISVNEEPIQVVNNNGILFIAPGAEAYSRATKMLISNPNSTLNFVYLQVQPNTNTNIYSFDGQASVCALKFDNAGNYVSAKSTIIYYLNDAPDPCAFFSDGSFICGRTGTVIAPDLTVKRTLYSISNYNDRFAYTSFFVDTVNNLLYAGTNVNTIQVYSTNTFQNTRTINTKGQPILLFLDNGHLTSLSNATYYDWSMPTSLHTMDYSFIEQF